VNKDFCRATESPGSARGRCVEHKQL